ncbi:MAG: GlmL-related ornithine degradation protein [Clostridiales bacterium]|nr:GlmL-related ornithine degradation protein [Clostridiales bacterium]
MKVDVLVAEIGSTTTVVNAFNLKEAKFLGQGQGPTTVLDGDVTIGLNMAIEELKKNLGVNTLEYDDFLATSSAAGGLRMTVHGLVFDMTARAAREAALGAGAIIKMVTAGKLRRSDLNKIKEINPNIILVAGGLDFGERDTALYNAEEIAKLKLNVPVIYAGNIENHEDVKLIFEEYGQKLYIVDNVYPRVDELNVEPTRKIIQAAFEEHITGAPGMKKVRQMVNGPIIPTPGAVMESAILLSNEIGDLMVIDVGGATTDVHSVTEGSDEIQRIMISPEPVGKRTVEGDLGVYVNLPHIVERIGLDNVKKVFDDAEELIQNRKPIPQTAREIEFVEYMTQEAVLTAVRRHAGAIRYLYGPTGKKTIAEGKDLTNVKWIVGTGGALTRLPNRIDIMKKIPKDNTGGMFLYPKDGGDVLVDNFYIMASLGVLSKKYPEAALSILKQSLGI